MAVRAATIRDLVRLWRAVSPDDFDDTFAVLAEPIRLLVDRDRRLSAGFASQFYRASRLDSGVAAAFPEFALPGPVDPARLSTSLTVTGPVAFRKSIGSGASPVEAVRRSLVATSGATGRHVLNAARETITAAAAADPVEPRWRRVTSGTACEFCRMLAGRGAVYARDTVDFQAHDHCACMPAPQF